MEKLQSSTITTSDMCLFHPHVEEYIEQSNAQSITSYISSHRKATANSIKKWATTFHIGVTSIVGWIRRSNSNTQINRMYSRQRRSLLDDSHKKERLRFHSDPVRLKVAYGGDSNELLCLRVAPHNRSDTQFS